MHVYCVGRHGGCSRAPGAQAERLLGRDAGDLNLIVAHLGAGASMAAIRAGRSVDTSMGLTPLEGCARAALYSPAAHSLLRQRMRLP